GLAIGALQTFKLLALDALLDRIDRRSARWCRHGRPFNSRRRYRGSSGVVELRGKTVAEALADIEMALELGAGDRHPDLGPSPLADQGVAADLALRNPL